MARTDPDRRRPGLARCSTVPAEAVHSCRGLLDWDIMTRSNGWSILLMAMMVGPAVSCGGGAKQAAEPTKPEGQPPATEQEPEQLGWGEWWKEGDSACPAGSVVRQIEEPPTRSIVCARANPEAAGDKMGQPHGRGTSFHASGGKAAEGLFEDGMHGPWTYWDEGGKQLKIEHYEHGVLRRIEYVEGTQGYKEAMWLLCNSVVLSGARRIKDPQQAEATNAQWIQDIISNAQVADMLAGLDPTKPVAMKKRIQQEVTAEGIPQCPLLTERTNMRPRL